MNNFVTFALFAATVALAGCGVDVEASCSAYVDAYSACHSEAFGDTGGIPDSLCDYYAGLSGSVASDAATMLDCYTAAYSDADCSTAKGFTDAGSDCAVAE